MIKKNDKNKIIVIFFCVFITSCGMKNGKNKEDGLIISCRGLIAQPVYLHYISDNIGYAFVNNGDTYSHADAVIYKTIDGGNNWEQVNVIEHHLFTGSSSIILGDNIYCYINSEDDFAINRIICYNYKINTIKVSDYIIQSVGDIWEQDGNIYGYVYVDSGYSLLIIDTNLYGLVKNRNFYKEMTGSVCCDKNHKYFLTYDNYFVIQGESYVKKISIRNPQCITKLAEGKVLIVANTAKNIITLYEYYVDSNQLKVACSIYGYNIAKHFRMDMKGKNIIGFVGNISGHFIEYDMVCISIEKQRMITRSLLVPYKITPNDITEKYLYIFVDRNTIQRYTLTQ